MATKPAPANPPTNDNQPAPTPQPRQDASKITINDEEIEVPDKVATYVGTLIASLKQMQTEGTMASPDGPTQAMAEIAQLKAELAAAKMKEGDATSRADAAEGKLAAAEAAQADAEQKRLDAEAQAQSAEAISDRISLIDQIRAANKDAKVAELARLDSAGLLVELAKAQMPSVDFSGKSPDFIRGALAQHTARADTGADIERSITPPLNTPPERRTDAEPSPLVAATKTHETNIFGGGTPPANA